MLSGSPFIRITLAEGKMDRQQIYLIIQGHLEVYRSTITNPIDQRDSFRLRSFFRVLLDRGIVDVAAYTTVMCPINPPPQLFRINP